VEPREGRADSPAIHTARPLRLIVGLGNPGPEYESTPHNLGFRVIDRLAERHGIRVRRKECMAVVGPGRIEGSAVLLAKPQTYMNLSGHSVQALLEKHSIPAGALVLIYDDLDLPWNSLRIRGKGSAGGHHGVESVSRSTGSTQYPRVRLGIAGYKVGDGAGFVLSPFRRGQVKELDELLDHAAEAVESIISAGVEKSMTKFNRRARGDQTEEE
jgi:PTH1 family peptidyl-tRNA hydrolase